MKRSPPAYNVGIRYGLARRNLSADQLAHIGAIALTYNDVEELIDQLTGTSIGAPFDDHQVVSRINGIDGKIALIKLALAHFGGDTVEVRAFADSLGNAGFSELKKYRDGVVHSRVFNASASIGKVAERKGARSEVLLVKEALEGLLARLELLWHELDELTVVLAVRRRLYSGANDDQHKAQLEERLRDAMVQHQSHRSQRLSLAPLPEFPAEPEAHSLPDWKP
jgi:hypothetical protein